MPQSRQPDATWHLDRKVPISIIVTIIIQLACGVFWVSKLDSRIAALENNDIRQEQVMVNRFKLADERYDTIVKERERLIRVEEQLKFQSDILSRIEGKVSGRSAR